MKLSAVWQNVTMGLVSISFVAANLGWSPAVDMWRDGAPAIGVFMGIGIGAKMVHRTSEMYVEKRYGNGHSMPNIDRGD